MEVDNTSTMKSSPADRGGGKQSGRRHVADLADQMWRSPSTQLGGRLDGEEVVERVLQRQTTAETNNACAIIQTIVKNVGLWAVDNQTE